MMNQIHSPVARISSALVVAIAMMTAAATSLRAQEVTDAQISTALEHEYLRDTAVPIRDIKVHTKDGIVTLTGEVETLAARQQAQQLASIVKGVRSVINRLELAPTQKSPEQLRRDVAAALRADPVAESFEVNINADSMNRLTLTGRVDSWAEHSHIETVAMTVPGVMAVTNRLHVGDTDARRGEVEIAEEIRARLRWDVRVNDSLIDVLVADGARVMLSGTVGSFAEKLHAERLAWVAGVREVLSNQLEVAPWAKNESLSRDKFIARSDSEIDTAITAALRYDPRVLRNNIEVETRNGIVYLSGSVDSLDAKHAAEQNARNTIGAFQVQNNLSVRADLRDDAALETLITNALEGYGLTDSNDVDVTVSDSRVYLTGDVENAYSHWQVEAIASAVRGVTDVVNELTIDGQPPVLLTRIYGFYPQPDRYRAHSPNGLASDREIYDEIQSELFWSPFVDHDEITVEVDNGVVTLRGEVESAREYQAAQENAFEGGALVVHNELNVASQ